MRIPCTSSFTFALPIECKLLSLVRITFSQLHKIVLQIDLKGGDIPQDGTKIVVDLDEKQTSLFSEGAMQVQLTALSIDGKRLNGNIHETTLEECLCKKLLRSEVSMDG